MSDVKVYMVNTKGRKSLNVPSGSPLYNGQMVRFSEVVVKNTKWIKNSIASGELVEVKKTSPSPVSEEVKVEKPEVEFIAKKSGKKAPAKQKEAVVEEPVVEEAPVVIEEVPAAEETPSEVKDENVE